MQKILWIFVFMMSFLWANGEYHTKIGDNEVWIFSLKTHPLKTSVLLPQNQADEKLIKEVYPKGEIVNQHNVMLIKNGDFIALVDTGFPDTIENLKNALKQAKLNPSDVSYIIITHAHFDHIGGLLENNQKVFPKALVLIDKKEYDYWLGGDNEKTKEVLQAYQQEFFNHDKALIKENSAVFAIPAYGHTPGHNMIVVQDKDKKLVFWADLLHAFDVQTKQPSISVSFDVNAKEAAQTRTKFLEQFSKDKTQVIGSHVPFFEPLILESK